MNDNIPGNAGHLSARRRLIRGSFSAPVALTLFSGGVAARSIQNCVTRQNVTGHQAYPVLSADNTTSPLWVRVQLRRFQGKVGTTNLSNRWSRWIRGSDVVALQAAGTSAPYLLASQWQLYDRGTLSDVTTCSVAASTNPFNPASAYAAAAVAGTVSTTPTEAGTVACGSGGGAGTNSVVDAYPANPGGTPDQWVALRIDASGNIVGAVIPSTSTAGSGISQSCWTSFRVG